jgi:hypothetical protein
MPFLEKLLRRYEILAYPQFILDEKFQHTLDDSEKNKAFSEVLKGERLAHYPSRGETKLFSFRSATL